MHLLRTALRGRMGVVTAAAVLLMMVGMLSVSADTAYAAATTETAGAQCTNTLDDNGNGWINEGCAQVGATSETGVQCGNATEDDGDPGTTAVNDGCPAATGANYNNSASLVRFRIPGTPATRVTGAGLAPVQQCSGLMPCTLTVTSTAAFPTPPCAPDGNCQILVVNGLWGDGDKDGAEILTYNSKTGMSFNIIQRGPAKIGSSVKKPHFAGSLVKVATVLFAPVTASDGPQTRMTDANTVMPAAQNMSATQGGCTLVPGETFATCLAGVDLPSPFAIQLTSSAGFTATPGNEFITINHQDLQSANQSGVGPGQSGEMMKYSLSDPCGGVALGANQICIIRRAQESTNRAYPHKSDGYPQPSQVSNVVGPLGTTKVSLHFQLTVKSNAGFFPAGNLLVCNAGNPLTNCELMGHNNSVSKIKTVPNNQFHVTDRCADASTLNKAPNTGPLPGDDHTTCSFPPHAAGTSIVTGADNFILCRVGAQQPGVDGDLGMAGFQEPATQVAGTSVGQTAVCYTQGQPKDGPAKPPWPFIVGQDLLALNAIAGQTFLGTGGYSHVALGAVGISGPMTNCNAMMGPIVPPLPFDPNGPNGGTLVIGSPCIPDFTPGTNLQVTASVTVDKLIIGVDTGSVSVVTDTIHDNIEGNADDCDDPAAGDTFQFDTYDSAVGEPAITLDDDTDRDGCVDERELRSVLNQGGLRDPWNPYDWYDINHDGAVAVTSDLLQIALANGAGNPNYLARKDRGVLNYGPFGWNKSAPNGSVDITSDVLGAAQQISQPCLGHDPNTGTATHESYDVGAAWPAGDRPWYCVAPQVCNSATAPAIPNHGP